MADSLPFASTTPNLGLPLLFLGQSQKEVTVNESLALVDMLLCGVVQGQENDPVESPQIGFSWIVGENPTGIFAGHARELAGWTEGGWRFVKPVLGMRVFDRQSATLRDFDGIWQTPVAIAAPSGGAVVDTQVRTTVAAILELLRSNGIILPS